MKNYLTIALLLLGNLSFSQKIDSLNRSGCHNIYFQAIKHYLEFNNTPDGKKIDVLYVSSDGETTDSLPFICNGVIIVKTDGVVLKGVLKQYGAINLYRIRPVEHQGNMYYVKLSPLSCGYKEDGRTIEFQNPGYYRVIFELKENKLVFLEVEKHII